MVVHSGSEHNAGQRMQFSRIKSAKWSRGCACNQKFALRISENVAMCMIYNGVEQKLVADRPRDADPFSSDQILLDAIANHAHRDVLAYTKLKFSIASATPRALWALDSRKLHPLLCVVPAPTLHASPMWVVQNVELSSLSLPTGEHIFDNKFTYDLSHGCPRAWSRPRAGDVHGPGALPGLVACLYYKLPPPTKPRKGAYRPLSHVNLL